MAEMTVDPRLMEALARAGAPNLASELNAAAGGKGLAGLGGFFLDVREDLLTVFLLVGAKLVRYEITVDGRSLSVCVPAARIARVTEELNPAGVAVVIELDADRRTLRLAGTLGTDTNQVLLDGDLLAAAFYLEATGDAVAQLREFVTCVRALL
jgi:hypothetical protein